MEHVLQHFRKEEQPFIEQVVSMMHEVENRYAPKLTDFLDPRQQFIVDSIRRQYEGYRIRQQMVHWMKQKEKEFYCILLILCQRLKTSRCL